MPGGFDTVLVVDFGAQYAQLIARRVRECHVYSEIVPSTMPVEEMLAKRPKAIILSGGPSSVYADGAPPAPPGLFDAGVPVLGICYGFQLMVAGLGGTVERTGAAEYGRTALIRGDDPPQTPSAPGGKPFPPDPLGPPAGGTLLAGTPVQQRVWMSHGDTCTAPPPGFTVTARTEVTPVAVVENEQRRMFGVQFHPEVMHTEHGHRILARFLELAGCRPSWTMLNIVEEQVALIREQVGGGRAICGLSGGVDSAVAAALVQRAIGDRLTCVFVDHGLLRKGEAEQVEQDFVAATGVRLMVANEAEAFLSALAGVAEPERKRKIIGREFIRAFDAPAGRSPPRPASPCWPASAVISRAARSNARINCRPDDLPLLLGFGRPGQGRKERLGLVRHLQTDAGGGHEVLLDLFGLTLAQQPMVDEHAGETVADGALHERRGDRGVHPAGQPADRPAVADLLADRAAPAPRRCSASSRTGGSRPARGSGPGCAVPCSVCMTSGWNCTPNRRLVAPPPRPASPPSARSPRSRAAAPCRCPRATSRPAARRVSRPAASPRRGAEGVWGKRFPPGAGGPRGSGGKGFPPGAGGSGGVVPPD